MSRQRPWSESALATPNPVNGIKAITDTGQFHNCNIQRVAIRGRIAAADATVERVFRRPATGRLPMGKPVKSAEKTAGRNASGLDCLHSILRRRRVLISGSSCGTLDRVGVTQSVTERLLEWLPCHDALPCVCGAAGGGGDRRITTPTERPRLQPEASGQRFCKNQLGCQAVADFFLVDRVLTPEIKVSAEMPRAFAIAAAWSARGEPLPVIHRHRVV